MKLGVLDWGIGGLGVVRELMRAEVHASITYLSDSGFTPYGKATESVLRARVLCALSYLREQGAEKLVVACNAASTVLTPEDKCLGMLEAGLAVVPHSFDGRLLVLGGVRTIESRLHSQAFAERGIDVVGLVAQPLSAVIERGEHTQAVFDHELAKVLSSLDGEPVDGVLLACTHYPAASAAFERALPGAALFDPAAAIPGLLDARLSGPIAIRALTTGDVEGFSNGAMAAWAMEVHASPVSI